MSRYNATVRRLDRRTHQELDVFLAEVDDRGRILRSNWLRCTGLEGTVAYVENLRRTGCLFEVSLLSQQTDE